MKNKKLEHNLRDYGFFGLGGGFGDKLENALVTLHEAYCYGDLNNQRAMTINSVPDLIRAYRESIGWSETPT